MHAIAKLFVSLALLLVPMTLSAGPEGGGPKIPVDELWECDFLHPEACPALARLAAHDDHVALFKRLLDHEEPIARRAGARLIQRRPSEEIAPRLVPLLADPDPDVRTDVLNALSVSGSRAQATAIMELLAEEQRESARVAALRALGRLEVTEAIPVLIAALDSEADYEREAAALSLGLLRASAAWLPLATLAATPDLEGFIRLAATRALVQIGDRRAIPTLFLAATDPDVEIQRMAVLGLGALNATGAVPLLIELLSQSELLAQTIRALGQMDDPRVVDPLLTVLRAEDLPVDLRRPIPIILGRRQVTRALPELLGMLRDPETPFRIEIIDALGHMKDERALTRLIELLESDDPYVIGAVNTALSRITGELFDPDPEAWSSWLAGRKSPPQAQD